MDLSIIITVYNTKIEYLEASLYSIRHSTLDPKEYELLMIDDGSRVDYTELIEKYGVRCVRTENGGILAARTLGVDLAEGEYVAFVDSDDTVSTNYHLPMLDLAKQNDLDIVYNDWAFHTTRTRYYCNTDTTISRDMSLRGREILSAFLSMEGREHSYYVLWNKLYRKGLIRAAIKEVNDALPTDTRFSYSEDALINFYCHLYAKSVENIHTGYYFYRVHDNQTVAVNDKEKLISQISNMTYTLDKMQTIVSAIDDSDELISHVKEWRALMCRTHFSYAREGGFEELYHVLRERYKTDRLEAPKLSDSDVYASTTLLGENFTEIDDILFSLYNSPGTITVAPVRSPYAKRYIEYLKEKGRVVLVDKSGIKIPSEVIRLKDKLIHNSFVYKIGMLLFPKGSAIRRFLKKRL